MRQKTEANIFISFFLIFLFIFLLLYVNGEYSDDYCYFKKIKKSFFFRIIYIIPLILGYYTAHFFGSKKKSDKLIYGSMFFFIMFVVLSSFRNNALVEKYINTHPSTITKGIITKRKITLFRKTSNKGVFFSGKFLVKETNDFFHFKNKRFFKGNEFKCYLTPIKCPLHIGDTILIKYAVNCPEFFYVTNKNGKKKNDWK